MIIPHDPKHWFKLIGEVSLFLVILAYFTTSIRFTNVAADSMAYSAITRNILLLLIINLTVSSAALIVSARMICRRILRSSTK